MRSSRSRKAPKPSGSEEAGVRCAECQQDNPAGAKFCNACGARLEAVCSTCGRGNAPGS
ncbi:MAG: double zinc ribbon domain-containing protein, partial [Longimicrobiales bacterium]